MSDMTKAELEAELRQARDKICYCECKNKELSKNLRGADNAKALAEEIADVEIMLEQLKVIFRNRALVDRIRAGKLVRLSDRITGEARE